METKPRYYLVIDLEATCDEHHRIPRAETEIIELGAVLCDAETLERVDEFQTFVKPRRHPKLTPFCTQLTSIEQKDVDGAPPFPQAMQKLALWLSERQLHGQFVFCSWGDYDKHQLAREEKKHNVRAPLGTRHVNLKAAFAARAGEDKELGTGGALRRVGVRFVGTAHRGIDDARNIAKLLPYCLGRLPIPAR